MKIEYPSMGRWWNIVWRGISARYIDHTVKATQSDTCNIIERLVRIFEPNMDIKWGPGNFIINEKVEEALNISWNILFCNSNNFFWKMKTENVKSRKMYRKGERMYYARLVIMSATPSSGHILHHPKQLVVSCMVELWVEYYVKKTQCETIHCKKLLQHRWWCCW